MHSTDTTAPSSVNWFAYSFGSDYLGGGNFSSPSNPGFEGLAAGQLAPVPEPSSAALAAVGLAFLAWRARRPARVAA